jgi:hypothetical protein
MDGFDASVVALVFLELGLDLRRVADEEKLFDLRVIAQRHDCAPDKIWWPEIAAHGVESDFHRGGSLRVSRAECKRGKAEWPVELEAAVGETVKRLTLRP